MRRLALLGVVSVIGLSVAVAVPPAGARANGGAAAPAAIAPRPAVDSGGYVLAAADGGVFAFARPFAGSAAALHLRAPIVGIGASGAGDGYWLVASDGGVFAYGSSRFFGSMGGRPLNAPIVAIAPTPDAQGYWLLAADGGVFSFGSAGFFGSLAGAHVLGAPVGIVATASRLGYDILTDSGEVFSFGDALAPGAPPAVQFPVSVARYTGIARVGGTTRGYVVVTATGVQRFGGDATTCTATTIPLSTQSLVVGVTTSLTNQCSRWLASADGGVFSFQVLFDGSAGALHLVSPIVGIAS